MLRRNSRTNTAGMHLDPAEPLLDKPLRVDCLSNSEEKQSVALSFDWQLVPNLAKCYSRRITIADAHMVVLSMDWGHLQPLTYDPSKTMCPMNVMIGYGISYAPY